MENFLWGNTTIKQQCVLRVSSQRSGCVCCIMILIEPLLECSRGQVKIPDSCLKSLLITECFFQNAVCQCSDFLLDCTNMDS